MSWYPKSVYSTDETVTERNMKVHDAMVVKWYNTAERLFPSYYRMNLKERALVRDIISEECGFDPWLD